jgi:hypothetical protein
MSIVPEMTKSMGLGAVLETLKAHYTFDAIGRIVSQRHGGVLPRFVLGRASEGCIWRFRSDLDERIVVSLARLAGREPGARFDGELPAPPERLAALARLLDVDGAPTGFGEARRELVTRSGVTCGELWRFA